MVAIAVSAIIIVAIVSLVTNSIRNAIFSRNNARAVLYAQQVTEWVRSERDTNIENFLDQVTLGGNVSQSVWCFDVNPTDWSSQGDCGSKTIGGIFTREAAFDVGNVLDAMGVAKTVVHVNTSVEWTDALGAHVVTNSTDLTDWRQR